MELIHDIVDWMIAWAATPYASLALFILAFWESSFFPLPPDPLLTAMAVAEPRNALLFALICTTASVLGAALGYFIGKKGGRPVIYRLFKEPKVRAAEKLYQRYDVWAVGAAAFTPIPYKVFTITAGIATLRFWPFIFVSIAGRGARFFLLGLAVYFFGPAIQTAIDQYFELLTISFLVLLVLGFVTVKYGGEYLHRKQEVARRREGAE
ncbi:MAG TPA: YqaA family protein [Rubrobacteraceae bacterium]|nr:YqaA family protein [Rubrobacteraceae bacterium]